MSRDVRRRLSRAERRVAAARRRVFADFRDNPRIPAEVKERIAAVRAGTVPIQPVTIPLRSGVPREVVEMIGAVMGCDMDKVLG